MYLMDTNLGMEISVLAEQGHLFQIEWEQLLHMHSMELRIAELFSLNLVMKCMKEWLLARTHVVMTWMLIAYAKRN